MDGWVQGDVFTEVERRGGQMTETDTVRQVVYPFLLALDYLHANNIIHRDIKVGRGRGDVLCACRRRHLASPNLLPPHMLLLQDAVTDGVGLLFAEPCSMCGHRF